MSNRESMKRANWKRNGINGPQKIQIVLAIVQKKITVDAAQALLGANIKDVENYATDFVNGLGDKGKELADVLLYKPLINLNDVSLETRQRIQEILDAESKKHGG